MRAGQRIYARGSDLIVTAIVNNGAELIADGSIHAVTMKFFSRTDWAARA